VSSDPEINALSESLVDELVTALGLPKTKFFHGLFWGLFRPWTDRLTGLGIPFDRLVAEQGLPKASQWILTRFCTSIRARGAELIPPQGPLLVASNHPGAYDALVAFSQLGRQDIRWISSEIPFLNRLPHLRAHILFASRQDAFNRMGVMRAAIRHLQSGGALVYFGAGHRDPDPAVYPGAARMLDNWLGGIDFFFKHVPGLRLLPTVISGVVSEKWAHHPISWLRRKQIDKQRLSEFGQVITQLVSPGRLMLSPAISFGAPVTQEQLQAGNGTVSLLSSIIVREKVLLDEHCLQFGGVRESP
jgi:hypothetical protein